MRRGVDLGEVVGREADHLAGAEQRPGRGRRQVVLSEVHAGGADQLRDVGAIVDDQLRAGAGGAGLHGARERDQLTGRRVLGAQLQQPAPPARIASASATTSGQAAASAMG